MSAAFFQSVRGRRAVFALLAIVTVVMFVTHLGAYDLWWHLKAGESILRTGAVPHEDPFSFTAAGRPWTYHSWLSGVVLYLVFAASGVPGLIVLRAVLIAGSLLLSWSAARRRGVGAGLAAVLVLASCHQLQARALTRPYLFSFVLFVVFYIVVQRTFRDVGSQADPEDRLPGVRAYLWGGSGRLLLLPALTLLWANLHGGFLVGLLVIGAFGAAELVELLARRGGKALLRTALAAPSGARFRALLIAGLLCLAASLVTPYGPGTLLYPFRLFTQVKLTGQVQEWRPMPLSSDYVVFWALAALAVLVLARAGLALRRSGGSSGGGLGRFCADVLLLVGFGALAVHSVRHVSWFVLLVAPVLGYRLTAARTAAPQPQGQEPSDARRERVYVLAASALAVVLCLRQFCGGVNVGFGVTRENLPVSACDYLAERKGLPDRFFNVYEWGGYLIWRFWPQRQVFIDGRCLVYGDRIISEAMTVTRGREGWQGILERYGVEGIIIRYRACDSSHFFRSGRWHCIYWDDTAVIAVGERVRSRPPEGIEFLPLSNPVVFEERLDESPPEALLEEIETVLRREPRCWTALAERARCLLAMARRQPARRDALVQEALAAARQAVGVNDGEPETWRALGECRRAAGREDAATKAFDRARSLERASRAPGKP